MFKNLFDFGKVRSLKESIGFFIFHCGIALGVLGIIGLMV